eukprot:scaffold81933_cov28-Tisochrysis_lutea.AAC.3
MSASKPNTGGTSMTRCLRCGAFFPEYQLRLQFPPAAMRVKKARPSEAPLSPQHGASSPIPSSRCI